MVQFIFTPVKVCQSDCEELSRDYDGASTPSSDLPGGVPASQDHPRDVRGKERHGAGLRVRRNNALGCLRHTTIISAAKCCPRVALVRPYQNAAASECGH